MKNNEIDPIYITHSQFSDIFNKSIIESSFWEELKKTTK